MSTTQEQKATEILEAFSYIEDWETRYEYLIDMGKRLPPMAAEARSQENLVQGCQSQVWVTAQALPSEGGKVVHLTADSTSTITKGIVSILHAVYSEEAPEAILTFDIDGLMTSLELDQHLSPARRNGLYGMITKIKTLAAANVGQTV